MTTDTAASLTPSRTRDWAGAIRGAGLALVGAILLAASGIWLAPDLAADLAVRDTAVPRADARLVRGSCKTRLVLQFCDLTLRVGSGPAATTRHVHYVLGSAPGTERAGVTALAAPERPDHVTTDFGLDEIANRAITLALLVLGCLAACLAGLRGLRRSLAPA